jgi:hypothetical protein
MEEASLSQLLKYDSSKSGGYQLVIHISLAETKNEVFIRQNKTTGGRHVKLKSQVLSQISPCPTLTQHNKSSLYLCNSKMINLKPSSYNRWDQQVTP